MFPNNNFRCSINNPNFSKISFLNKFSSNNLINNNNNNNSRNRINPFSLYQKSKIKIKTKIRFTSKRRTKEQGNKTILKIDPKTCAFNNFYLKQ